MLEGYLLHGTERIVLAAYADDITAFLKKQAELNRIRIHFNAYEEVSGAKLNQNKSEAVWVGKPELRPPLDMEVKDQIKVLGIIVSNQNSAETNWQNKEIEIKKEIQKWADRDTNYKTRVDILKMFVLSKMMFLSTIFPPTDGWIKKMNKEGCRLVWGTNREVTKRELLYKPKKDGGLGSVDFGIKLLITMCRTVASAMNRGAIWIGNKTEWEPKRGKHRKKTPYFKLAFSDFLKKYTCLQIDWCNMTSKAIYDVIINHEYGGTILYRNLSHPECEEVAKRIHSKHLGLSEPLRDTMWLVSVRRLPVRAVVCWSCYVTTKQCPMPSCGQDETLEHLLLECDRTKEVWSLMKDIGIDFKMEPDAIFYGIFDPNVNDTVQDLFYLILCIVNAQIWKTRCRMTIDHLFVSSDVVFNQIVKELRRRRANDMKLGQGDKWSVVSL